MQLVRSVRWRQRDWWPWIAIVITLVIGVVLLKVQGRLWVCACGQLRLWTDAAWSAENSQQLTDPYSFTHVLHGLVFCGLLIWLLPRWSPTWQLAIATVIETFWEVVENSAFVIQRYRETTAALGYTGDTVLNSLGDIPACGLGFVLARYLGWRWSLLVFSVVELCLVFWIRDSLLLNILMLLYPVESIKTWQAGH